MSAPKTKGKGKGIRFLLGVLNARPKEECVIWPYSGDRRLGRGKLGYNGEQWWAHRLMCKLANGEAPAGKPNVRHTCGNGHLGCVNHCHLEWSSVSENLRDRRRHGTQGGGRGSRLSRLTLAQIAEIRTHQLTQWGYADKFGVTLGCVQHWWRSSHQPKLQETSPAHIKRRERYKLKKQQLLMSH